MKLGAVAAAYLAIVAGLPSALFAQDAAGDPDTGIRGRILDEGSGEGLVDAPVMAIGGGQTHTTMTEEGGRFVLPVPPGRYLLRSYYELYHGARLDPVRVRAGGMSSVDLTLEAIDDEGADIEEIEIVYRADTSSAAAQDQLRMASSGIGEGVGAEQMSRRGASDAGSAAASVAGVTLERGSQLAIRGLGGRYTRVLLNGVSLPSTDPDGTAVDLDLFPSSVIESLSLSRAFLPNMPASFAGGVLSIRTLRFPNRPTFQIGASIGVNTLSTFQDRPDYQGGSLDWLGFDDGGRSLPGGLEERLRISRSGAYRSFQELEAAGERFNNIWERRSTLGIPNIGLEMTSGESFDLGEGRRFGYVLNLGYEHQSVREVGVNRPRPTLSEEGNLEVFINERVESGTEEARLRALGSASLELGQNDSLTLLALFSRTTTDETTVAQGINSELAQGEQIERWQMQYLARTLFFSQLLGDHRDLGGERVRLRWSAFTSVGMREEPDRRSVTYGPQGGNTRWLEKAGSGERFYSDLLQLDVGGTLSLRFPLWESGWGTVGGRVRTSGREFGIRRYRMVQDARNTDQSIYQQRPEILFGPEQLGESTLLQEYTRENDSYTSRQTVYAAFAQLETPIFGDLSLNGGVRMEAATQEVASESPFPDENMDGAGSRTERFDLDVLPGVALRLGLPERMVLRAAYGMTLSRPQIRELADYQYYDFLRDRNIRGNPVLRRTQIHNLDLRWEWFFGEGELVAASAFYKRFIDPIELQILNADSYDSMYLNADAGDSAGGELELRLGFGRFAPELQPLAFEGNAAFIWSQVSFDEDSSGAVRSNRAMFGQAPYVINLALRYSDDDARLNVALVYNAVGPRISDVGTRVNDTILPDIVQQPFHSLNAVIQWGFVEHLSLKLKVNNLLFSTRDYRQGDFLVQRVEPGMSFSLGLEYRP